MTTKDFMKVKVGRIMTPRVVTVALPEGRHVHGHHAQPVVEVLPEGFPANP